MRQEVYLGKTIFGKSSGSGHIHKKTKLLQFKDKDKWIIVNNAHEPLISEEMFYKVRAEVEKRTKTVATRGKAKTSILTGIVKCGCCGYGMMMQRRPNKSNLIKACWHKDAVGNKCGNKGIAEDTVIKVILQKVKEYRDTLLEMTKGTVTDNRADDIQNEIEEYKIQLKKIKNRLANAMEHYDDGDYTREEFHELRDKYKAQQKDIESEIQLLERKLKMQEKVDVSDKVEIMDKFLKNIPQMIDDEDVSEKDLNQLFKQLVDTVEIMDTYDEDGNRNIGVNII